jgi:pyruvate dehydrogenase E1 component beta subunit/2-oxoisovalerate dehydrogenase E1 component beta subunit
MSPEARGGTSYVEAIRLALDHALAEDPTVFLYGEDIADPFGGAFKATKGLSTRHPGRVFNAPISEDAITGLAIGAAIAGCRPVIEFQFADFAAIAFSQLVNNAGTTYWRTGRPCPLVARLPVGGTPGGGPFHCQMPEGWLTHHPGLVVVAPSSVADAYGLLRDAIRCNDPVAFCEHKLLYNSLRDEDFDPTRPTAPLGTAAIVRPGRDCTIVSYGALLHDAVTAANGLAQVEGVEAEVIDLRCLRPLDLDTVLASVARTSRLVVATEGWPYGSVSAELVARIADEGFHLLDAPPRRISAIDTPIPFQPDLWRTHRPDATRIAQTVMDTVRF